MRLKTHNTLSGLSNHGNCPPPPKHTHTHHNFQTPLAIGRKNGEQCQNKKMGKFIEMHSQDTFPRTVLQTAVWCVWLWHGGLDLFLRSLIQPQCHWKVLFNQRSRRAKWGTSHTPGSWAPKRSLCYSPLGPPQCPLQLSSLQDSLREPPFCRHTMAPSANLPFLFPHLHISSLYFILASCVQFFTQPVLPASACPCFLFAPANGEGWEQKPFSLSSSSRLLLSSCHHSCCVSSAAWKVALK